MQLAYTAQGFATAPRESRGLNEPLGDTGMINNRNPWCLAVAGTGVAILAIGLLIFHPRPAEAQGSTPKYEVDPFWPRPLPNQWVTGSVGGVCTDAQDHVFIVNRRNLTDNELDAAYQAPWVIEFDPEGDVVNSWGDANVLGSGRHACYVDYENNVWLPSNQDGIVQKYSHDGSKLLLQIGARGIIDSSDGTVAGRALNSSHTGFYRPGGIAVIEAAATSTSRMERSPVATIAWLCLTETGGSFGSGFCIVRRLKWKRARAMSSCRYRTVWRLATTGWCTYATDGETGFRCSTKWGPSKKTYLSLTRLKALTGLIMERERNHRDRDICRGRGAQPGG